ncbi:hypothetical protein EDC14_1004140 [Hydrogenispora ethanolica]|uniref:Uncharacterized protein n=1 Tax=Hydrogenispora ethanolica TaxID=1082276 RepID=A0A4R1S6W7_HYDET|nr:hypothetical protein [Hydrogenispora ethanolica]TCL74202.1 hypothetical protein EDC14_1004140 [Hydrogenispora ethanolica]
MKKITRQFYKNSEEYEVYAINPNAGMVIAGLAEDKELSKALTEALDQVASEYLNAISKNPPFHSAHEGYAVLREELDELWDEVKKNERTRDYDKMLEEATQVTAMGLRFMIDVILSKKKAG